MALEIFRLVGSVFVDTDAANKSLQKTDNTAQGFGKTLLNGIGTAAKWGAAVVAAAGAVATGVAAVATKALESYAEYEQLVGGVETLFKDSAQKVIENAETAYKTAGITASDYMNTVTSFAASLLQSLGGDTVAAAEVADMAITDMSDNANKMGTTMESIQNAYQGFAKQNYTMLDNLKLGYGGTKAEMIRLLEDADAINAKQGIITEYSLDNLADIYEAIHVVQGELGIAGATSLEATTTLEGGIKMIKARLSDLFTEIGGAFAPVAQSLITMVINGLPTIEGLVDQGVLSITTGIEDVVAWLSTAGDRFQSFLAWLNSIGDYASVKLAPILTDLSVVFAYVKDVVNSVIESIKEYFTSGQAATDATNFLKSAIDFLADAYDTLKGLVLGVIQGYKDLCKWIKENETTVKVLAIAVGTLTAAIVAYNVAQAIKHAGGIAEIAQLAAIQVGIWALTAAETAHTAAATIGTAVTTAFGAAVSFLTSPITLVILAIGALIAIVVLLVENWDTVKAAAISCWDWIKNTWNSVAEWFDQKVVKPVVNFFSSMWNGLKDGAKNAWEGIKSTFSSVTSWFKDTFTKAWTAVKDVFSKGGKIFDGIKDGIVNAFKTVVNGIIGGINKVIAVPFNAINSVLSKIKSIEIVGIKPFDWVKTFSVPEIPQLYQGGVLERGQVGLLEGNGAEAVVPLERNKQWISAVAQDMAQSGIGGGGVVQQLLEAFLAFVEDLPEILAEAANGQKFTINQREFARLVKAVE